MTIEAQLERIAKALEDLSSGCACDKVVNEVVETPEPAPKDPAKMEYPYPDPEDRPAWEVMAKDRGIEIPKRTRTATIIKKVQAWDTANPEGKKEARVVGELTTGSLPVESTEPTPDPFEADPAPPTVSQEDTLKKLQDLRTAKGTEAVFKVLKDGAGVDHFNNIPEDKYATIYEMAIKEIG